MSTLPFATRAQDGARLLSVVAADGPPEEGLIQFGGGLAFPQALPDVAVEAALAAHRRSETMQYGPLFGLLDLRVEISNFLRCSGIRAGVENLLIVNGAKQALDLAARVFLDPGDEVILTEPTYLTAIAILRSHQAKFMSVPMDHDGMCVDVLEGLLRERRSTRQPLPKLLFDVMDFHNPTGVSLTTVRRQKLLTLAEEFNFVILEDDPYSRIRFSGKSQPPVKSLDLGGRVIGLGTVSKILAPGIRVGWANGESEVIGRMAIQKSDGGSSPFNQRIVATLLKSGAVEQHINRLLPVLKANRDTMLLAFQTHLPDVVIRAPDGGYFLWAEFPVGIDSQEFAQEARKRGVVVFPGQSCFASGRRSHHIRLAYSHCALETIDDGVQRLARAYDALRMKGAA